MFFDRKVLHIGVTKCEEYSTLKRTVLAYIALDIRSQNPSQLPTRRGQKHFTFRYEHAIRHQLSGRLGFYEEITINCKSGGIYALFNKDDHWLEFTSCGGINVDND